MIRKCRLTVVTLILVVGAGMVGVRTGSCYLLPAQQLMGFVAKQTSRLYNFRLDAVIESQDPAVPGGMVKTPMVYYAARPDRLRQETLGAAGGSTVLVGSGVRLSVIDGHLLKQPSRHEEIFPVLMFADSANTLMALLEAEHVDTAQVHLSRFGKEIAYVIGGPPGDSGAPQFWCDKDRFWPLRLVGLRSREGVADVVDIRFLSHREVAENLWMPTVIEFYRQNQLVQRVVVQQAYPNQRLPDRLFDLKTFAAQYPPLPSQPVPPEKPAQGFEEMQRYLERKYQ
jgi:hypothetical protein